MLKKVIKLFFLVLICFSIISSTTYINAYAAEEGTMASLITNDDLKPHKNEPLTKEEKVNLEKKVKEAEKYVSNKRQSQNNKIAPKIYGSSKKLSTNFPAYAQSKNYYCGPAAAYNAIKFKNIVTVDDYGNSLSQSTLAKSAWLNTDAIGSTNFDSRWTNTMNAWAPGNNYTRLSSSGYSLSDWKNKLMNSVIWTIDKGYPVIADTKQHVGPLSVNLSSKYATDYYNNNDCYHYVVIYGYDDTTKMLYFSDSHSSFNGLYSITLSDMASLTDDFGIIW